MLQHFFCYQQLLRKNPRKKSCQTRCEKKVVVVGLYLLSCWKKIFGVFIFQAVVFLGWWSFIFWGRPYIIYKHTHIHEKSKLKKRLLNSNVVRTEMGRTTRFVAFSHTKEWKGGIIRGVLKWRRWGGRRRVRRPVAFLKEEEEKNGKRRK